MSRADSTPAIPINKGSPRSRFVRVGWPVFAITLIVALLHGLALWDGVVLDDHWHQKGLREHGWTFPELLRTLIIAPADYIECWWQTRPVVWHYFRPFFIVCMKFAYLVVGRGDETALHALSLGLHWLSSLLVWRLCLRLTGDRTWSLLGGLVFAIYPHSVVTVAWPSSQNVVIQNTLLLGVVLAYLRASRIPSAACEEVMSADAISSQACPSYAHGALAATWTLWLLAIFTRENAILFPAILASFELASGGWRRLWARRAFFFACGAVGVAFMAWRTALGIDPLPDVYCHRPDGQLARYAGWLAAKLLHYLCVSIWPAPMVAGPTGRMNPWVEVPGDCTVMVLILAGMGWMYFRAARRTAGWWIWPLWIVLSILPVVAVVATPHSGYMSGVGVAVGMAIAMSAAKGEASPSMLRPAVGLAMILGMAFMAPVTRLQWMGTAAAERIVPGWVQISPPAKTVTDVFFINQPFVNVYLKPDLDKRFGPSFSPVRVHALTFAPHPTGMDRRSTLEQVDAHSFVVRIEGQAYFSRLLGRFLVEGFGDRAMFEPGRTIHTDAFDVTIVEHDARGVWALKFAFPRPLTDPSYCFYFTSGVCGAAKIRFAAAASPSLQRPEPPWLRANPMLMDSTEVEQAAAYLEAGYAAAAIPLLQIAADEKHPMRSEAQVALRPVAECVSTALGARCQFVFDKPSPDAADWREVATWWALAVRDENLREVWQHRRDFEHLVWLRAENEFDRWIASGLIRTDMYLTGPPYRGPFE
ncbi:hypothetical protein RAS2_19660 [Phycisphaerae bacterium RAS2]|nr:hypothetical protein RAS2_19660 [Phycisphaerae bacterium RAS2]